MVEFMVEFMKDASLTSQAQSPSEDTPSSRDVRSQSTPESRLIAFLEESLAPLGYEVVAIECVNHREKKLRLFIDHEAGISIDDCVQVTHALDLPLEQNADVNAIFKGPYELEVSSPGIDRPLRKPTDFDHFAGEIARISTFRPLTAAETQAAEYTAKNPKQKNFYGILRGFNKETNSIQFGIIPEDGTRDLFKGKKAKPSTKNKTENQSKPEVLIHVPHELVAKAHLDPAVIIPEERD